MARGRRLTRTCGAPNYWVPPTAAAAFEDAMADGCEAGDAGDFGDVVDVDRVGHADELVSHNGADIVVKDLADLLPDGRYQRP